MSMIPITIVMLLAAAIYSCCVKMRHRLEDEEKKSNHPLELSDKAASIWNELSEPTSTTSKKPVKEKQEAKNVEAQSDKKQPGELKEDKK